MARKRRGVPWLDWVNGVAYAFWYDPTIARTKRISLNERDPDKAAIAFANFLTTGKAIREPERLDGLTVAQVLDDYFQEHVAEKVIDKRRQEDAIVALKAYLGPDRIRDVDVPGSQRYLVARRREGISDSTVRRELNVLQAAANHAVKMRTIKRDELPTIELPAETRTEALTDADWLTKPELAAVQSEISRRRVAAVRTYATLEALEVSEGRLKAQREVVEGYSRLGDFVILAYGSAGRRASIERLTRFQVNLQLGILNLRNPTETPLQRRSKKRRPPVPITPAMREVIERRMAGPYPEGGWLLGVPSDMYRPFRRVCEAVGLAHKSNPHILRHSRATHLLQDGVSLWDVAKLLGDTVATVERVYGHYCPGYLGATMERSQ